MLGHPQRRQQDGMWMPSVRALRWLGVCVIVLLTVSNVVDSVALGASTSSQAVSTAAPSSAPDRAGPDQVYGLWVIAPAVLAIGLAIALRQVIPALALGIFAAAMMHLPWSDAVEPGSFAYNPIAGVIVAVETYLIGTLRDVDHLMIIVFTLVIGGVVEVISANGGTAAMVDRISRWASNPRRGQLAGWAAGVAIFFGDYPNMLIVGPTMRPVFDRLRISRAKLAYIVDSTAAPIASLALVGTWVGVQVGYIQDGLADVAANGGASWINDLGAFQVFVASIPYRFYPLFAIALVLIVALLRRDFGPMLPAERRAAGARRHADDDANETDAGPRGAASEKGVDPLDWRDARDIASGAPAATETPPTSYWFAVGPILALIATTLTLLILTGWARLPAGESFSLRAVMSHAESSRSMMYASLITVVLAIGISLARRKLTLAQAMDAVMVGFGRMLLAVVILSLAWAFSDAMRSLHLAEVATVGLRDAGVGVGVLPILVFLAAAGVSFATGTSWGTMGILVPVTVSVAAELATDLPPDVARTALSASVAAVLAGAIFGDHCSPISDTTVLSAAASQCTVEDHVWTQMPYALLAAGVAIVAGYLLNDWAGLHPIACLGIGAAALALVVRLVGRPTWIAGAPMGTGNPEANEEQIR